MSRSRLPDPVAGTRPSVTEKSRMSRIAKKKLGIETPPSENNITRRSIGEFRLTAAIRPSATPTVIERSSAALASSTVLGRRSPMTLATGWWRMNDSPRSRCRPFQSQRRYWTGRGSFKPTCSRSCATSSSCAARSPTPNDAAPIIASIGSPGPSWSIENTSSEASSRTGTASTRRCAIYRITSWSDWPRLRRGALVRIDHGHRVRLACGHVHLRDAHAREVQGYCEPRRGRERDEHERDLGWEMSEDHRVEEADALGEPACGEEREAGEDADP